MTALVLHRVKIKRYNLAAADAHQCKNQRATHQAEGRLLSQSERERLQKGNLLQMDGVGMLLVFQGCWFRVDAQMRQAHVQFRRLARRRARCLHRRWR